MFLADRLAKVYIGVTDADPRVTPPTLTNFPLCDYYEGPVAPSASYTAECGTIMRGRYVIVQIETSTNPLSLCEVQVFGGKDKKVEKMLRI